MGVRLSVNINKIATLRNARGGNEPSVLEKAWEAERAGAQGITVHPRPDERHIRYEDVVLLSKSVKTELNVEGYPNKRYLQLIRETQPTQATLVPDPPDALTSEKGWNIQSNFSFLKDVVAHLKRWRVRASLFLDPDNAQLNHAQELGADAVEFHTGSYAKHAQENPTQAVKPYVEASKKAQALGLKVHAGHDLNLKNLGHLIRSVPQISEVSIGHALVCDALKYGWQNTISMYLGTLHKAHAFYA